MKRYRVDGLIMVPVDENGAEWRGMVSRLDIPTVVITRHATGIDSFYVAHDEAGAQVARHLHEQGYEEYIFFGNTTDDKYLGFIDGMANECREFRKHLTIISSKDSQVIEAALKEHFAKTTGKTGIFAYKDRRAVQMMGILQKMKIRVPEQVGIVGFDNIYLCEVLYPSLSSIAQPNETMASLAVQRLLYRMDHPNDQKREDHPLHAELICRQSSDLKGVQQCMNALHRTLQKLVDEAVEKQKHKNIQRWIPHFHVMPPVGWLNDPNGLCEYEGTYYAFFQMSPFEVHGGLKFWGLCTSKDLVHWEYKVHLFSRISLMTVTVPIRAQHLWKTV